jgi:uncharacterized protein
MAGSKIGGLKARDTNIRLYGEDYYRRNGALGGKAGRTGGFASDKVGPDGLTGRERASVAGAIGGKKSSRRKWVVVPEDASNTVD